MKFLKIRQMFFILFSPVTWGFVLLGLALYYLPLMLLYLPDLPPRSRLDVEKPKNCEEVKIVTEDGVYLHAYLGYPKTQSNTTILLFHGNAGNIGHRIPIFNEILHLGYMCLMVEYRGYGKSTGSPSEKGIKLDVSASFNFLKQHPKTKDTTLIVYGQSLGGAVAIYAAFNFEFDALIVENTFLSIRRLVPDIMPFLKHFVFLCHQKWESENIIKKKPTLFLSSLKDEVIPPYHMKELYEKSGEGSFFKSFPNGMHNDAFVQPGYFEAIHNFVQKLKTSY